LVDLVGGSPAQSEEEGQAPLRVADNPSDSHPP
jgi:hypothetical protein